MPDVEDPYGFSFDAIEESIPSDNDLAIGKVGKFRDVAT